MPKATAVLSVITFPTYLRVLALWKSPVLSVRGHVRTIAVRNDFFMREQRFGNKIADGDHERRTVNLLNPLANFHSRAQLLTARSYSHIRQP